METKSSIKWQTLLAEALTVPGVLNQAYRRFWNYSIGNQMAAMWQCRMRGIQPGPLATYPGWQKQGRQVRKGEKALELCQPVIAKKKSKDDQPEADAPQTVRFFLWRKGWFVLSQTDGPEVPVPPIPGWDKAKALEALRVREIPYDMINGNCQGYARGREVAVSSIAVDPWKTLFHELAHVLLGHTEEAQSMSDSPSTPRTLAEVEAESVAMLVGASLELVSEETVAHSRGYIQNWAKGISSIPERSAQRIFHVADQIIRAGREASPAAEVN